MVPETDRQRLLAPVVAAGRAELADLDADDVPHPLRPVARSSARRLPPPLVKSLLAYIATDGEFRRAVSARVRENPPVSELVDSFLDRPEAVEALLTVYWRAGRADALEDELQKAQARNAVLEQRISEARQRSAAAASAAEQHRRDDAEAARRARAGVEQRLADAENAHVEASGEIERLEETIADLRESLAYLRMRLGRREDRERRRVAAVRDESNDPAPAGYSSDPTALAAGLDRTVRMLKYHRTPTATDDVPIPGNGMAGFSLPAGVAPDSGDAFDAVVDAVPDRIVIDGYNVAGDIDPDSVGSRRGRAEVVHLAEHIKRRTPQTRVIVVFDAAGADGRDGFVTRGGVEVLFEKDSIADDRIVEEVGDLVDRCVVVTSDRELQLRCERHDCVVLYSVALVAWVNR